MGSSATLLPEEARQRRPSTAAGAVDGQRLLGHNQSRKVLEGDPARLQRHEEFAGQCSQ